MAKRGALVRRKALVFFGHGKCDLRLVGPLYQASRRITALPGQNESNPWLWPQLAMPNRNSQRFMFATSSAGPSSHNILTAAGICSYKRLPCCCCCGDTLSRALPDPSLAQVAFHNQTISVNEMPLNAVATGTGSRIPAQIMQSLPAAINTVYHPANLRPAFLGLPQGCQGLGPIDYPQNLLCRKERTVCRRGTPMSGKFSDAVDVPQICKNARLITAGGVFNIPGAEAELNPHWQKSITIPVVETIAGRAKPLV